MTATLLAAMLFASASAPPQPATTSMTKIDQFVQQKIAAHRIPGLSVVIVRDGRVVWRHGYGELRPETPIIIGSLSKAFTATAVLQLVDAQRLSLDEPFVRYLREVRFTDPRMTRVTVRQLLNQTSGIPTNAARSDEDDATLQEQVAALAGVRLVAEPGAQHIYSSPNYQLLGRIVELTSGESFDRYVERHIFAPLRMTRSGASAAVAKTTAAGHNLWWGLAGPAPYRWEPGRLPTASLISSADDLAKFVLSNLEIGPQLLSRESLHLSHEGRGKSEYFSYAMGWREGTTAGVPSLWHGGALPSYRGAIVMIPQSRSAVIVLTNVSSMFADHTREIAAGIVAQLEGRALPPSGRPLRTTYAVIAIASLLLVALQLRNVVRSARGKRPVRSVVLTVLTDLLLPLCLLVVLPRIAGVSLRGIWEAVPDIVVTTLLLVVLSCLGGVLRIARRVNA